MLNRRQLLVTSLALPLAARAQGAALAPTSHFVAAARLVMARAAAHAALAGGAEIVWLGRDLTPVYTWLDMRLRQAPFALEGVTTSHDFFVIERLAWNRGLRTTRRIEHGTALEWRLEPRKQRDIRVSDTGYNGV